MAGGVSFDRNVPRDVESGVGEKSLPFPTSFPVPPPPPLSNLPSPLPSLPRLTRRMQFLTPLPISKIPLQIPTLTSVTPSLKYLMPYLLTFLPSSADLIS